MSEAAIKSLTQGHFLFEPYTPMGVRGDWVRLRADRVALPAEGAVVDLQDAMAEETAHFFMTPSLILRPVPPTQQQLDNIKVIAAVAKGHYPIIINMLIKASCLA